MLRIAQFIGYGGELAKNQMRETLVEHKRRPKGDGMMEPVPVDSGGPTSH